jgi:hypothetical protein
MPEPIVLFGIQFTLTLVAYALLARWYVAPRLFGLPLAVALAPLLWVHVFRIVGGTILAPGAVGPGVPTEFREMIGDGDMVTGSSPCSRCSLFAPGSLTPLRSCGPA